MLSSTTLPCQPWGPYRWLALPVAGGRAAAQSLCVQDVGIVGGGLAALISDESALEVCTRRCTIQIDAFTFTFFMTAEKEIKFHDDVRMVRRKC